MSLWSWLLEQGAIEGDAGYYERGEAAPSEYRHAIEIAEVFFQGQDTDLWTELVTAGAIEGDPEYYRTREAQPGELDKAITVADQFFGGSGLAQPAFGEAGEERPAAPESIRALPRDVRLVKVDGAYRAIWDLGDGLGSSWYTFNEEQLKSLYGEEYDQYVSETFANTGTFEAKYGNFYWGNVAEISLTADDPWQDLKDRIFTTFGYVSGLDTPEVKRLILEGYFEGWTNNEFIGNYQQTDYYNSLSDLARQWNGKSETEKAQAISEKSAELVDLYRAQWGRDPDGGIDNTDIVRSAEAILKGEMGQDEWKFHTRTAAEGVDTTPAARDQAQETRDQGEQSVTISNLSGFAKDEWRKWMGPTEMPTEFAERWGQDLYWNRKSQEDLDLALSNLSQGTWEAKPENVTWEEWAAPVKSRIKSYLELPSIDDNDALLGSIMGTGLTGQDATMAIRNDPRFRSTTRLYDELSSSVSNLGRQFGFIA